MKIAESIPDALKILGALRHPRRIVGLVPTMGALHEGHLSLVRAARLEGDVVIVSVFANPAQFGPGEDYESYPRDLDADAALLEKEGVGLLFAASPGEMYPQGYATYVEQEMLGGRLCGASRPNHFRGVLTVVLKLFNIFSPDKAFFGQKDAQQVLMIRRMVADLNLGPEIRTMPIVREADGLAMSSRNRCLSEGGRRDAASLYRALCAARDAFASGEKDPERLEAIMSGGIVGGEVDYARAVDPDTLEGPQAEGGRILLALAVRCGETRLIDNLCLDFDGTEILC